MTTKAKHIGILGLGSRSTLFYLKELNKQYYEKKGGYHTFPCVVYNVDFNTINSNLPNNFEKLIPELEHHLKLFFQLEIDVCLIPNITLHETYDLGNLKYPIIHPITLAIEYLNYKNIQQVTVFGSKYTMESQYIKSKFEAENIEVKFPKSENIVSIDFFRQNLYKHQETDIQIQSYKDLVTTYSKTSTVLIACTELSIIHSEMSFSATVLDLAQLQIEKALEQFI